MYSVSIPFKRESTSKLAAEHNPKGFERIRFNSLQTGKHIQTRGDGGKSAGEQVSIPFKRESTSKRPIEYAVGTDRAKFQFPSNGKAHPNQKRNRRFCFSGEFQFPSNGKAHPNFFLNNRQHIRNHQFQFPSNGKAHPNPLTEIPPSGISISFNSLQTGKHIQTLESPSLC